MPKDAPKQDRAEKPDLKHSDTERDRRAASPKKVKEQNNPKKAPDKKKKKPITSKTDKNSAPPDKKAANNHTAGKTAKRAAGKPESTETNKKKTIKTKTGNGKKQPKRRALTPEQAAALAEKRRIARAAGKRRLTRLLVIVALTAIVYIAVIGVFVLAIVISNNAGRDSDYDVRIQLVTSQSPLGTEKKTNIQSTRSSIYKNGGNNVYINMNNISEALSIVTVGDGNHVQYMLRSDHNEYALMTNGSCSVEINGVEVTLPAPVIIERRTVFVPEEFFVYYCSGVEVHYSVFNKQQTITVAPGDIFRFAIGSKSVIPNLKEPLHL